MKILQRIGQAFKNLWRGMGRVFAPEHDDYPETGTRPLTDDTYNEKAARRAG
jgi:hypothetical protein